MNNLRLRVIKWIPQVQVDRLNLQIMYWTLTMGSYSSETVQVINIVAILVDDQVRKTQQWKYQNCCQE